MNHTDPIADMLTRIRNAQAVEKADVAIPYSNMKLALADVLKGGGFINDFEKIVFDNKSLIKVSLKYTGGKPRISGISRVSKPGSRVYSKYKNLHSFLHGTGIYIISTPKGLMSDKEARKNKIGGEIICSIW